MGDESSVRKGIVLFADGYIPGILLRVDSESNLAQPPHSLDAKPGPSGFAARPRFQSFPPVRLPASGQEFPAPRAQPAAAALGTSQAALSASSEAVRVLESLILHGRLLLEMTPRAFPGPGLLPDPLVPQATVHPCASPGSSRKRWNRAGPVLGSDWAVPFVGGAWTSFPAEPKVTRTASPSPSAPPPVRVTRFAPVNPEDMVVSWLVPRSLPSEPQHSVKRSCGLLPAARGSAEVVGTAPPRTRHG